MRYHIKVKIEITFCVSGDNFNLCVTFADMSKTFDSVDKGDFTQPDQISSVSYTGKNMI
jgi:hypothetical protein